MTKKRKIRPDIIRNQITSLIIYEKVKTTLSKAKVLKSKIEDIFTKTQKNDLNSFRYLSGYLYHPKAALKMKDILIPSYIKDKNIIRIAKLLSRGGDKAPQALVYLIKTEPKVVEAVKTNQKKKKSLK